MPTQTTTKRMPHISQQLISGSNERKNFGKIFGRKHQRHFNYPNEIIVTLSLHTMRHDWSRIDHWHDSTVV